MTQPPPADQPPDQPSELNPSTPEPAGQQPTQPVLLVKPSQAGTDRTILVGVAAGVLGLLIGGVIGSTIATSTTSTTGVPVVTATVTATSYQTVSVTSEPTDQPTDERTTGFNPEPKDFVIGIKILSRQCLGSAGCSVSFRIEPKYVGGQTWPAVGSTEVTYQVTGDVLGPTTNTFTIDAGGTAHFDEEESAQTKQGVTLRAKAIEVTYDPNG